MEEIINTVLDRELGQSLRSCQKIVGLGQVNEVYAVEASGGKFIVRLNNDISRVEYPKEAWCISAVAALGIPSPKVYGCGRVGDYDYMLEEKLPGLNGKLCPPEEKKMIWKKLGEYARVFHQVADIDLDSVQQAEFHADWKARLNYNLKMLNQEDTLLTGGCFTAEDHQLARSLLVKLKGIEFATGLVHGDLCPRNTLLDQDEVYLIDWGTAAVNVVPHTSLGLLLLNEECTTSNFESFLRGYGISTSDFLAMKSEINLLNFLHCLDKYRWAETYASNALAPFISKVEEAFVRLKGLG